MSCIIFKPLVPIPYHKCMLSVSFDLLRGSKLNLQIQDVRTLCFSSSTLVEVLLKEDIISSIHLNLHVILEGVISLTLYMICSYKTPIFYPSSCSRHRV